MIRVYENRWWDEKTILFDTTVYTSIEEIEKVDDWCEDIDHLIVLDNNNLKLIKQQLQFCSSSFISVHQNGWCINNTQYFAGIWYVPACHAALFKLRWC